MTWRGGDNYIYQLTGTVHEGADLSDGDARPRLHGPSADESISPQGPGGQLPDSEVHPAHIQLSLEVAA